MGPVITGINPAIASPNTNVTIGGYRFKAAADSDTVGFNGIPATVQSASDTALVVLVPPSGTNGPVTVVTSAGKATGPQFTYGPDIYVAGFELAGPATPLPSPAPKYWKNGVGVPIVDNTSYGFIYSMALGESDVYLAGYAGTNGCYWDNEGITYVGGGIDGSQVNAITLANGNIYSVGSVSPSPLSALLWINGVTTTLSSSTTNAAANAIAVSGSDIYVGGWSGDETHGWNQPAYWKNGVLTALSNGTQNAVANAIQIVGNDVYVAGSESNGSYTMAKYWKNGSPVVLTSGGTNAGANAIAVVGNDVYVAGFESDLSTPATLPFWGYIAKYWKNGVPVQLGTSVYSSEAFAIAIK